MKDPSTSCPLLEPPLCLPCSGHQLSSSSVKIGASWLSSAFHSWSLHQHLFILESDQVVLLRTLPRVEASRVFMSPSASHKLAFYPLECCIWCTDAFPWTRRHSHDSGPLRLWFHQPPKLVNTCKMASSSSSIPVFRSHLSPKAWEKILIISAVGSCTETQPGSSSNSVCPRNSPCSFPPNKHQDVCHHTDLFDLVHVHR